MEHECGVSTSLKESLTQGWGKRVVGRRYLLGAHFILGGIECFDSVLNNSNKLKDSQGRAR